MFDVLVYLFENYYQTETYPDQDTLERKLHAAGFENDDIQDALDWLNILTDLRKEGLPESLDARPSFRGYSTDEAAKLSLESRGFIAFLENAKCTSAGPRSRDRRAAASGNFLLHVPITLIILRFAWRRPRILSSLLSKIFSFPWPRNSSTPKSLQWRTTSPALWAASRATATTTKTATTCSRRRSAICWNSF